MAYGEKGSFDLKTGWREIVQEIQESGELSL